MWYLPTPKTDIVRRKTREAQDMERSEVVKFLREKFDQHRDLLMQAKDDAEKWGGHADWPWNGLVLSAATRGGSARWDRNVKPRYERELSWAVIEGVTDGERRQRFETVGRFWRRTAKWLEVVYQHILDKGGPPSIRATLASMDADAVIAFWRAFLDIGDKYARNMMMDVYDRRFRDGRFAVDSRIKALLPGLGYQGRNLYVAQEGFLNALASDVAIEGWELDRLLYQANNQIAEALY
jgi:hypothetical protein